MEENPITSTATASLCARCSAIDFDSLHSLELSSKRSPEFNLGPVTNWAVDSCAFCGFLAEQIPSKNLADPGQNYRLEAASKNDRSSTLADLFAYAGGTWLRLDPVARIFHLTTQSNNSRPSQLRLLDTDNIDFEMILHWLSFCHESHPETCGTWSPSVVEHMKLIDCQTLKIVPATNEQYITLSKFSFQKAYSQLSILYYEMRNVVGEFQYQTRTLLPPPLMWPWIIKAYFSPNH
jgi:hypothetical protein